MRWSDFFNHLGSPSIMHYLDLEDKKLYWESDTGISMYQRFLKLVAAWGIDNWKKAEDDWS